jgi:bifunctional DNA-binding transcriptional regulator/antitoxin component of YhaV-PrlF toxin-antitoxin module
LESRQRLLAAFFYGNMSEIQIFTLSEEAMSEKKPYYKTRLRGRGQITLPPEIRKKLKVGEGDDVLFYVNQQGQVVVDQVHIIDPEQAWFWTERWQNFEREVDEDIAAGRVYSFEDVDEAIAFLDALDEDEEGVVDNAAN